MTVAFTYVPSRPAAEEMEDDPVEMADLKERHTGVPGVICVSTGQGQHGPRVKWYPRRGGEREPVLTITLEEPPRVLNHDVPPREASGAVAAAEWAALNRAALLTLWFEGSALDVDELSAFLRDLKKLP